MEIMWYFIIILIVQQMTGKESCTEPYALTIYGMNVLSSFLPNNSIA